MFVLRLPYTAILQHLSVTYPKWEGLLTFTLLSFYLSPALVDKHPQVTVRLIVRTRILLECFNGLNGTVVWTQLTQGIRKLHDTWLRDGNGWGWNHSALVSEISPLSAAPSRGWHEGEFPLSQGLFPTSPWLLLFEDIQCTGKMRTGNFCPINSCFPCPPLLKSLRRRCLLWLNS